MQCTALLFRILKTYWSVILDDDGISAVTMWIAGDFQKVSGRKLLLNAMKHLVSTALSCLLPFLIGCVRIHLGRHNLQIHYYDCNISLALKRKCSVSGNFRIMLPQKQLQHLSAENQYLTYKWER